MISHPQDHLPSRKALLQKATALLAKKAVPFPQREAEDLLAATLTLPRLSLFLDSSASVSAEEEKIYWERINRRACREPFSQIIGEVCFLGSAFCVNRDVLTPRPETEILASLVAQTLQAEERSEKSLWDLCCGTGCLGISLKKLFPWLTVTLSDLSLPAAKIAKENGEKNGVSVSVLQGDLFSPFGTQTTDFLVCNPPYLAEQELAATEPEVHHFEPACALVAGPTGLEFYERIAASLPHRLNAKGKAWLEIGDRQGKQVQQLFSSLPGFTCEIMSDWAGKDRFAFIGKNCLFS